MVTGSKICAQQLNAVLRACHRNRADGTETVDVDPDRNPELNEAIRSARQCGVPDSYVHRMFAYAEEGYTHFMFHEYDTNWDSKAYQTISGQNSNNSIRIPHGFFEALQEDGEWQLTRRTDGVVTKSIRAKTYGTGYVGRPGRAPTPAFNTIHDQ